MRRLFHAMPAYLRLSLAAMLQYRGEIVLWAVWGVVYPTVAMAMWRAALESKGGGQGIGGYGASAFAAYFLLTMVIGHLCTAWDVYEMGYLVRSGALSPRLLRPILPVWQSVSDNLAYKTLTLAILLPIWGGVAWLTEPAFTTTRTHLLLSVPTVILAAILNYLYCYLVAMLAFWFTRMEAAGELWFATSLFFGGRFAPLTILPGPLQAIAACLPFKWIIWFPTEGLMGRLEPEAMAAGILYQLGWLAVGLIAFAAVWRSGVKRYSAVGA